MFKHISRIEELPAELTASENRQIDFKSGIDLKNSFEMAKDVAAFANNLGGVVLLGAQGDSTDRRLERYSPLSEKLALEVEAAYELAIRDRCRPKPIVDIKRIAKDGGFVVAVNVMPFPGQPVGVATGVGPPKSFAFPYRTLSHTIYLTPDQLPMFTLPEIRKTAILLASIPAEKLKSIVVHSPYVGTVRGYLPREYEIEFDGDAAVMNNTIRLKSKNGTAFTIPTDSISHVWQMANGQWGIVTSFTINDVGGVAANPYLF